MSLSLYKVSTDGELDAVQHDMNMIAIEEAVNSKSPNTHNHDSVYISRENIAQAIGRLDKSLTHLPLKKNLLTSQGQSICTFTRASMATYRDRYGVLKSAASDTQRFNGDGLIVEGSSTNMLTYSEEFEQAVWSKARISIAANAAVAPNGMVTAFKITEDTSGSTHVISQTMPATGGWLSVFAKAGERTKFQLRAGGGADARAAGFDLSNGTIFSETQSSVNQTSDARIEAFANGWYRCSILAGGTDNSTFGVFLDNGTNHSYTGDGLSGLYIWGAQWESGAVLTSYIPTTAASATRAYDNCTIQQADNIPAYNGSFTISINCIISKQEANQFLFSDVATDSFRCYTTAAGKILVRYGTISLTSVSGYVTGAMTRITFVKDGVSIKLYINGILEAGGTVGTLPLNPATLYLGSYNATTNKLYGSISNLRIYDFAMTAEEVRLA